MRTDEDPVLRAIREANPQPSQVRWADTDAGRAVADRVRREAEDDARAPDIEPPHRRRIWPALLAAALLISAVGATYAVMHRGPASESHVLCTLDPLARTPDQAFADVAPGSTPLQACRNLWPVRFGTPIPDLVGCVDPGGGVRVIPRFAGQTPSESCSTIGSSSRGGGS
jgi:hypothetical protein